VKNAAPVRLGLLLINCLLLPLAAVASVGNADSSQPQAQDQAGATAPPPAKVTSAPIPGELVSTPTGFWDQDTLTGDRSGLRKNLEDDGFKVTPTYTALVIGNPSGGARQGVVTDGLVNVQLDFDLEKMTAGEVDGLLVHANALYLYGPSLSRGYVGDFSGTTSINGYNTIRLQELWLEKSFLNQKLSIRVGNMGVDNEFFQSSSAGLFINNTFVDFALFNDNIINAPLFPVASPGVRLKFLPTPETYVMAGVYGMDNNSNQATTNQNGTRFALTSSSGMLIMSEAGYLLNQAPNDKGLQGTYRVGSFVHTANYDTWGSQAEAANGTGPLKSGGVNYGVYGVVDQQLYSRDSQAISIFLLGGGASSNINLVDWSIDGGFNFTGFLPGRGNDVAGLAFAHSDVSANYSDGQVSQGNAPYTAESFIETTYKVQIAPWWSVQPDFQYYFTPSGQQGSHNAVVLGLSTNVAF
jgi:porin